MAKDGYGAGHGGNDPGAVSQGNVERDLARSVNAVMVSLGPSMGIQTVNLTVDKGYPFNINEPVYIANANGVRYAVQNHFNAGGGTGVEVLYYAGDSGAAALAAKISAAIASTYGLPNRGAKPRTDLGFINGTTMTGLIIEWGFVDAPGNTDCPRIMNNINAGVTAALRAMGGKVAEVIINPGTKRGNYGLRQRAHVQDKGWLTEWVSDGRMPGTKAGGLRLEALEYDFSDVKGDIELQITLNIQNYGQVTYTVNKNGMFDEGGKKVAYLGSVNKSQAIELITVVVLKNTTGRNLYLQGHRSFYGDTSPIKLVNKPRTIGSMDQSIPFEAAGIYAA